MQHTFKIILIALLLSCSALPQKKIISTDDLASWEKIENPSISKNAQFFRYELNPQRGNGVLIVRDLNSNSEFLFERGYSAQFSENSRFIIFKVKPEFEKLRIASIKKTKKDDLPKDTLCLYFFESNDTIKISEADNFSLPEKNDNILVYTYKKDTVFIPKDSIEIEDTSKVKSKNKKKVDLVKIIDLSDNSFTEFIYSKEFVISKDGSKVAIVSNVPDSIPLTSVIIFDANSKSFDTLFSSTGDTKGIAISNNLLNLAFNTTSDTGKTKNYDLRFINLSERNVISPMIYFTVDSLRFSVNQDSKINFSESGERLFFEMTPFVTPEPEDSLTDEEKVKLDLWSYTDPLPMPQQLLLLERRKRDSYLSVFIPDLQKTHRIENDTLTSLRIPLKNDAEFGVIYNNNSYRHLQSFDRSYSDVYTVNISTGEYKKILEKQADPVRISPGGKFLFWFDPFKQAWFTYSIFTGEFFDLTSETIANFHDVEHDLPIEPAPEGIAGFTESDSEVFIYDTHNIWSFSPSNSNKPVNLTAGKEPGVIRYRYIDTDKESDFIEKADVLLSSFNTKTKDMSFSLFNPETREIKTGYLNGSHFISYIEKAEDKFLITLQTAVNFPDVYIWTNDAKNPVKLTAANKNQSDFVWLKNELFTYTNDEGEELESLIFYPDNIDKNKKYPTLIYFYEKYADQVNRYWTPGPSRSVIPFPLFTSNGYVVIIPDIKYKTGYPGGSALNCVMNATDKAIELYPFIDDSNMGLQGQSWGGYQTAYIITRTQRFKAAMAGAPVANMTSAYGGIRWGSGLVRMFQYERGQSRIGENIWEARDLYLENSPLFFLDNVTTPLLIMHNDKDDAVPWYQGIELFMGLRRLGKMAWMLNYNDDLHNLKESSWGNRIDLTKRLLGFFDHFLKGEPAPEWIKEGIPAKKKGKSLGY